MDLSDRVADDLGQNSGPQDDASAIWPARRSVFGPEAARKSGTGTRDHVKRAVVHGSRRVGREEVAYRQRVLAQLGEWHRLEPDVVRGAVAAADADDRAPRASSASVAAADARPPGGA